MWTRPKSKKPSGPTKRCPVCEKDVELYKDRFVLHGLELGQGLCPGAGLSVLEPAPQELSKPKLGAKEIGLCQSFKNALVLCGYEGCQVFVQIEGLRLEMSGYAEVKSLLPHLQRYGATLQKSTFCRVCVFVPVESIERLCGFLHRKAKRTNKQNRKLTKQLDLFSPSGD